MPTLTNIALVGAGGHIGHYIASALLARGQHQLTALTRPDSTSTLPRGFHAVVRADYTDHAALVHALRGQHVLIISLSVFADPQTQHRLIDAAKEAGVAWIMPNDYGMDPALNEQMGKDNQTGPRALAVRTYIEQAGMKWVAMCCSFWYEFSLSGTEARYGFDFPTKHLTLYDAGTTKIPTSTWPQVGRAVASLLSRPTADLEAHFANRAVHISSFHLSQRDMLASVLRVTGDDEAAWTLTREDSRARFERGRRELQAGDWKAFGTLLYARCFFPGDGPRFEGCLDNEVLGLPVEDVDEFTRVAIGYVEGGQAAGWS